MGTLKDHPQLLDLMKKLYLCEIELAKQFFTHQFEAAARQPLVNVVVRNNEVHNHGVQMRLRQLEQDADAGFSHHQKELLTIYF